MYLVVGTELAVAFSSAVFRLATVLISSASRALITADEVLPARARRVGAPPAPAVVRSAPDCPKSSSRRALSREACASA